MIDTHSGVEITKDEPWPFSGDSSDGSAETHALAWSRGENG